MKSDLEQLQGRWLQVEFEENGVLDPPDTHGAPGAVTTIVGQTFHVAVPDGETLLEGDFVIGGSIYSKSIDWPKKIDWIDSCGEDAGKIIPAIYELEANRFRFAAADPGQSRPEGFAGGQGITIRTFVRL